MAIGNLDAGTPKQLTASANVKADQGILLRIFVSASTAGTITVYDDPGVGTTNKVVDTFTATASTTYTFLIGCSTGINIVLGGTISCTVVYA